jgi:hypothetical protein
MTRLVRNAVATGLTISARPGQLRLAYWTKHLPGFFYRIELTLNDMLNEHWKQLRGMRRQPISPERSRLLVFLVMPRRQKSYHYR